MAGSDKTTQATVPGSANSARQPEFVVAVGASAGALEALRTLLGGMAAGCGATLVVVVHRSPGYDGRLADAASAVHRVTRLRAR